MSSQLKIEDKDKILRGIIKKVGDKPYENGYWGEQPSRDIVLVELYDQNNNLIDYKNLTFGESLATIENDYVALKPGLHLKLFGYDSGKFNIRYRFLRNLAGNDNPILIYGSSAEGTMENVVYPLIDQSDYDNLFIDADGKIFTSSQRTQQLLLTNYMYDIDKISSSRTEVRLKAKKIDDFAELFNFERVPGYRYVDDFVKLQESVKKDIIETPIEFIGQEVTDFTNAGPTDPPTITYVYNTSNTIQITPQENGLVFTPNMIGGTINIPNFFFYKNITEQVKTQTNIFNNPGFEDIEIDANTGQPTIINTGWDSSIHNDAIKVNNWTSGFNSFDEGEFAGSTGIGYHAKFVRNEGKSGGNCIKFIDQNEVYIDYDSWPSLSGHRELSVKQQMLELQSLGPSLGDVINITFDMKSTVVGKGVEIEIQYPNDIFVEEVPSSPPPGYYDPNNPGPTEEIPDTPPDGYIANTDSNATNVEAKPPQYAANIMSTYGLPSFNGQIGDDTEELWNGAGAWKITDVLSSPTRYVWSPNLGVNYTQAGTLSTAQDWIWNVSGPDGAWGENNPSSPEALAGTVNSGEFPTAVNGSPYQFFGQGTPKFSRDIFPGENTGWQTGTVVGSNGLILLKDDLIWELDEPEYTTNASKVTLHKFADYFPGTLTFIMPNGKTLYEDIFENGYIQSITRTKETGGGSGNMGIRDDWFVVFYSDGSGEFNQNKGFLAKKGENVIGSGYGDNAGVKVMAEIDGNFNNVVNENGGKFETCFARRTSGDYDNKWQHYFSVPGSGIIFRMTDGDGDFFELAQGGEFFDDLTDNSFANAFGGGELPGEWEVAFSKNRSSGHWSNYRCIIENQVYNMKSNAGEGISETLNIGAFAYGAGQFGTDGAEITFGSRNPAAANFGILDDVTDSGFKEDGEGNRIEPLYDDGSSEFNFPTATLLDGFLSPAEQWKWDGGLAEWVSIEGAPAYNYESTTQQVYATNAGQWAKINMVMDLPDNWDVTAPWYIKFNGHNAFNEEAGAGYGIVWVDNVFADFTLVNQTTETPLYKDFTAQIDSITANGTIATLNRNIEQAALALSEENPTVIDYVTGDNPGTFDSFSVSYLVYNPYDLRTYLKMGNRLFLTTNFKKDVVSNEYPFSVVYKLYEPLPIDIEELDEVSVVKEMMDPTNESVEIVEFVDNDVPTTVLKSPDIMNVESPIQRRTINYKNQTDILSSDAFISDEIKNEFLSQSMDSVEINVDHSDFKNFVNFSSAEKRISNFKYKAELIESYKVTSASYIGVSGSADDLSLYHNNIKEVKNNFDPFEKYMYFQSSSYISSSIGVFHDNAWPKTGGSGAVNDDYILAHTTSSLATTWYNNQISSASLYDTENLNKLSNILPNHIKIDSQNQTYLTMTDMMGHHFDNIWVYIKAMGDTYDRREKLNEGISKDLLMSVGKSLGWQLNDGKDTVSLARYALGKEVTGSAFSNYSSISERDASREVWSRIINNMPYFLKNKGTIRAIKGLISAYGIPSTILRVKEYGGPDLPDDATPQFEIKRKFTKSLDFRSSQYIQTTWSDDSSTNRKPDTIEFRFKSPISRNQVLVEKTSLNTSSSFYINLKDNGSTDDYGYVAFQISGSDGMKEISSSNFPVYDNEFHSVMVRRTSGSDNRNVSQSFELSVGKYDASRSKIHLYSTSTLHTDIVASSSYNQNWENDGTIFIGGTGTVGGYIQFSGSLMEYRHWTEVLNTGSFKNHIGNPKAFDGNTISSSYNNLVLRYSFDDNKDLSSDTDGIRDVSANTTNAYSGSHHNFSGNFFKNVEDETKTNIPSIGGLRRVTNKVRIEENKMFPLANLSRVNRATISAYDQAPTDSNKVGVFFAPTDVINNDIIESVANLNFDQYLGDPRDLQKLSYRGLKGISDKYWQKYTSPNNFWDYIRLIKYYDQSLFPQVRKMIPARAKPNLGILIEPNIFERPKAVIGKTPQATEHHYSASIDVSTDFIVITGSYNHGRHKVTKFTSYDATIDMYSYDTGSSFVSASGEFSQFNLTASITEIADRQVGKSIWTRLEKDGDYSDVTMSFGDFHYTEALQPIISGSRIRGNNQKMMKFYNSFSQSAVGDYHSSSFYNVDIDNLAFENQAFTNLFYEGCKQTIKTTTDKLPPVQFRLTSPTRLVKKDTGDSTLDTGEGTVAKFKTKNKKVKGGKSKADDIAKKAVSKDDAVQKAVDMKGGPLTKEESEKVIGAYEKESGTKPTTSKGGYGGGTSPKTSENVEPAGNKDYSGKSGVDNEGGGKETKKGTGGTKGGDEDKGGNKGGGK